MLKVQKFTFNPFQENTYVVFDESKECLIIDPGCLESSEKNELKSFIKNDDLKPVQLLNTHCHLDHIYGNHFVAKSWNLKLHAHELEKKNIESGRYSASIYGLPVPDNQEIEE